MLKKTRVCVRLTKPAKHFDTSSLKTEFTLAQHDAVTYKHGVSKSTQRAATALWHATLSSQGERALAAALATWDQSHTGATRANGPTSDGWTTSVSGNAVQPPDGSQGQGVDAVATATKDINDVHLEISFQKKESYFTKSCPDAKGEVPGTGLEEYRYTISGSGPGGSANGVIDMKAEAKDTGHIDDSGHLKTYDHSTVMTGLIQIRQFDAEGHEITSSPPELYTFHMAKNDITPPIKSKDTEDADFKAVMPGGDGPYLKGSAAYNAAVAMTRLAGFFFRFTGGEIENEFKHAEDQWQSGACVHVSGTPAKPQLGPGQSTTIAVTVTPPAGTSLAPGRLEASTQDGTVSPTKATYGSDGHVQLRFTAPSSGWSQGTGASISLKVVSREGSARTSVDIKPVNATYTLSLTSSSGETFSPVKYSYGTGSASYSVGGQATITSGTGSGALTWSGFSYSDQNVEELCQDGKSMIANFTGTGTDSGQMNVQSLDLSSGDPTLKLEIVDPTEHVFGDFQSGASACAPFTQTYDFHQWAYIVERACWDGPSGVAFGGAGSTDNSEVLTLTGWQKSGSSYVKDMTYTPNLSPPGDTGTTAHLKLVLTPSG